MARVPGARSHNKQQKSQSTSPKKDLGRNGNTSITTATHPDEDKDATELKLEKLLFGDRAGFLQNLQDQSKELELYDDDYSAEGDPAEADEGEDGNEEEAEEEEELDALPDGALFMIDNGLTAETAQRRTSTIPPEDEDEDEDEPDEGPAWEDSDDERLTVSLASHSRLRKLRLTEGEDFVNGREYARRLRQQFQRLHPTPDWARPEGHRKKRRKLSESLEEMGSELSLSDAEMDGGEELLSAQPLARLLQSTESLSHDEPKLESNTSRPIRSGTVDVQRLRDVSNKQPSAVTSLSFHPSVSPPLLLSSGPAGLLSMHHISSISNASSQAQLHNPLLTTLAVPSLAIATSAFHSSGTRIFFAGRRRYFHIWDLPSGNVSRVTRIGGHQESQRSCESFKLSPCGRFMALVGSSKKGGGVANVLDATSGQWIGQARVEGKNGVVDLAWWANGEGLVVLSKSGEIVEYNISERRVVARWADEGAVGATVIALGGRLPGQQVKNAGLGVDRWVVVGSQSGIVNIYDRAQWSREKLSATPKPRKVLEQLVTPTSHLCFSPDGQLLVMASRWKKDALRLVHLPSCTVYKNWPTRNTPFGRVTSVAWARNSRLLGVGNEAGKVRLYEVRD